MGPSYTIKGVELSFADYHNILSGVRGPDMASLRFQSSVGVIKSCTALLVRRALYGVEVAAGASEPYKPLSGALDLLDDQTILNTVGRHYVTHAFYALSALHRNNLAAPEDVELVMKLARRFGEI
jgi:hypothetical protein